MGFGSGTAAFNAASTSEILNRQDLPGLIPGIFPDFTQIQIACVETPKCAASSSVLTQGSTVIAQRTNQNQGQGRRIDL